MDQLEVVDMDTVIAVLRVTDKTVRTWISDFGCPARKEGRAWVFDWPAVLSWYVDYQGAKRSGVTADFSPDADPDDARGNLTQATLRKTNADADIKEIQLAKLQGATIVTADARTRLERLFGNLRTALLGLPPKLVTRLAGTRDMQQQEAIVKEEIEILCRDLSTGSIVGTRPEDALPEDEPTDLDTVQAAAEPAEQSLSDADFQY